MGGFFKGLTEGIHRPLQNLRKWIVLFANASKAQHFCPNVIELGLGVLFQKAHPDQSLGMTQCCRFVHCRTAGHIAQTQGPNSLIKARQKAERLGSGSTWALRHTLLY